MPQPDVEVALQAGIEARKVGSVVSPPALAPLECAPECRLSGSKACPQIEDVREFEPAFLSRTNVDGLRCVGDLAEF